MANSASRSKLAVSSRGAGFSWPQAGGFHRDRVLGLAAVTGVAVSRGSGVDFDRQIFLCCGRNGELVCQGGPESVSEGRHGDDGNCSRSGEGGRERCKTKREEEGEERRDDEESEARGKRQEGRGKREGRQESDTARDRSPKNPEAETQRRTTAPSTPGQPTTLAAPSGTQTQLVPASISILPLSPFLHSYTNFLTTDHRGGGTSRHASAVVATRKVSPTPVPDRGHFHKTLAISNSSLPSPLLSSSSSSANQPARQRSLNSDPSALA